MKAKFVFLALLFLPQMVSCQTLQVEPVPDWASYATAAVNPTVAAVQAFRSEHRWCRLGQLGLSELVVNGSTLTLKHFIRSARPCLGCPPDGFPSGHTANSVIGISSGWQVGMTFPVSTAGLRMAAHRHTPMQVLTGALLGAGSEYVGHLLRCE
jgi:membrane-associated phospholipid phosphatase